LLDTTTAGVYDTVIADLNFDYWFDMYDDTAVLGTEDPVLAQDLGSFVFTDTVIMTGTQYIDGNFWWQEPATWWGWYTAPTTMTVPAGTWIWALDHYAGEGATDGADGIADVSGGMVYYIADGERPVPGMDYLYPTSNIEPNGALVAFMIGSYWAGGGDHGTLCASAATAAGQIQGHYAATGEWVQYDPEDWTDFPFGPGTNPGEDYGMPWIKGAGQGIVQGPAPEANIIAIGDNYAGVNGMQGFMDAYTFLAYGVDGLPNSGDEFVDVVSMSYGDGTVHNDGWDWESRLISYYNQQFLPNTTFFASSGNGGAGYGTINSPQGNTTVSVGASSAYGQSTVWGSAVSEEQFKSGDVSSFSGRGPDAYGRPDPDVVANGAWGAGDTPLNLAPAYAAYANWFVGDGNQSWYEWGGTSRAAPEAAGVGALVYQAYMDANGGAKPDFETVRQIMMGSADNLNHDVLIQGAGRVNADRATDVAGDLDGVYTEPSLLAAGEYMGTHYESFANVLFPGDTWGQTFTVNNAGDAAATVTIGDELLVESEVQTYKVEVKPYTGMEDDYASAYYAGAHYFVVADPSLTEVVTDTYGWGITSTAHGPSLAIPVPDDADFMEVQLVVPFEIFDFNYNDPDPYSVSYNQNQRWSLVVYDWTDRNANDALWHDAWYDTDDDPLTPDAPDGIVNPWVDSDALDSSWYLGNITQTEIVRYNYSYNYANVQEVVVGLDETRKADDNIVIGITHRNANDTRDGWGEQEYADNPLLVKVVFYEKADWGLVETSVSSLSVPAGGSATFDADFTIPADQKPGLYEGAITVDDGTHLSIIPTTVNVAVPGDEMLFTLGGEDDSMTPYDNGKMERGYSWYGVYEEGDWRFFFYDAAAGFEQQTLYVQNQWGELCGNMPTANETLIWGPNPGDQFSLMDPAYFGPYSLQYAGGTWDAYGRQNGWGTPRQGDWWNSWDGPQPETRVWGALWDGLNQVQFRNILLSGKVDCGETYEATAGVFGVNTPDAGIQIDTDKLSGSFTLDTISPVDGMYVWLDGFGDDMWFRNQDVPQGKHPMEFPPPDLMDAWVYTFEVTDTYGLEAQTFGPSSSDIDLYLLYDANNDGFFNMYDNREWLDDSTSWDSFEYVSAGGLYENPGTYALVMYGNWISDGDQFDLHLITYGDQGLIVEGATPAGDWNFLIDSSAGVSETVTVNWEVPENGIYYGYLSFEMPYDQVPANGWSMGPSIGVPVIINAGGVDFSRSSKVVDQDTIWMSHGTSDDVVLTYTVTLVNDGLVDMPVRLVDLLPEGTSFYEQFVQDPDQPAGSGWWYDMKVSWENGAVNYYWHNDDCWAAYNTEDFLCWQGDVGPSTSGKVYIEYQVKVDPGFFGQIMNKADFWIQDDYDQFYSLFAYTDVLQTMFLPYISE
jgi:hypothetical protein